MKRKYVSPELEITKINLSDDVLRHSEPIESMASSGVIIDPDEELVD